MSTEFTGRGEPSRTLRLLWRSKEPATRGPKPTLTIDAIVEAAVAIADAEGLAAVSMRKIAERLGAGTMSLYRHVPAKGELIDLMLDAVIGEADVPPPGVTGWRARLEYHARAALQHYRRHPWVLGVSLTRPPLGPNLMANFEAILTDAAETGLPVTEWVAITELVNAYVIGAATVQVPAAEIEQTTGESNDEWWAARMEFWESYFVPADHPTISRTYELGGFESPVDSFEWGLQRTLDGIAARVDPASATAAVRPPS